ncbi:MAG: hypothetical protein LBD58_08180 [Treponema sp.]|jgi:hypothetical protein|nr:hypothetical protein [Treponema sp.]
MKKIDVFISKLMAARLDCQNKGFGTKLLQAIEACYKNKTFDLVTSEKSDKNIIGNGDENGHSIPTPPVFSGANARNPVSGGASISVCCGQPPFNRPAI